MKPTGKLLLIFEVIALFIGGSLLSRVIGGAFGLREWLSEADAFLQAGSVDFVEVSYRSVVGSLLKYGTIFLLVIGFLKLRRQKIKPVFALTTNRKSWSYLFRVGVLIFCVAGLVPKILFGLWPFGLVGDGPAHWQILNENWDWSFWLYALTTAIIIPPIVEELFFRGYAQKRFGDGFSVGVSIILMAIMFATFHTQYFQLDIISLGNLVMLFVSSVMLGYSRHYTGSLIPGLIAHALVNISVIGTPSLILSGVMLIAIIGYRKALIRHWNNFKALV